MKKPTRALAVASSLALAGIATSAGVASAANTSFDQFSPLASSVGPTADEAKRALDGNLCRCGTNIGVLRAVLAAKGVTRG